MQPNSRREDDMNTPPRSPTKAHSPQRLAEPVQVSSPEPMSRRDVESIRIYADSDISALLSDVENEINRMALENPGQDQKQEAIVEKVFVDEPIMLSSATFQGR